MVTQDLEVWVGDSENKRLQAFVYQGDMKEKEAKAKLAAAKDEAKKKNVADKRAKDAQTQKNAQNKRAMIEKYIKEGDLKASKKDYAGAIEDFEMFVSWTKENGQYDDYGVKREAWITELKAGRNPFDEETLEELRDE